MDTTIIKEKIRQIIEHEDKDKYILPHEFIKSKKNVIVVEIKEVKGLKDRINRFFSRTDEHTRILLSDSIDFKINGNSSIDCMSKFS